MASLLQSTGEEVILSSSQDKVKRVTASKMWCFTLNNYTEEEYVYILTILKNSENCKFIVGKEVGESGTPHLQGYVHFDRGTRPMEKFNTCKRIHWEKCRGTEEDNIKYCSKDGKFETNLKIKKELKILKNEQLFGWELKILCEIEQEPDSRTINWYVDTVGNAGKTSFCKYLVAKHDAGYLSCGKANDLKYYCSEHEHDVYLFDFPRSQEDFISYQALEEIKNGIFFCGKYESDSICRNSPHVYVFANFYPDITKMSQDRWHIVEIRRESHKVLPNDGASGGVCGEPPL